MLIKQTNKIENKRTNNLHSREKKVPTASIRRRLRRPLGGEAWKDKPIFEEALSLAKKSAQWFPSLKL